MKGAGTVANARDRACFKGNDNWERLGRVRFDKAQRQGRNRGIPAGDGQDLV